MILYPTDFLIYDLRLSDFYLSTNAFLNRKSQFINYKLIDSFIFNFQLSIFNYHVGSNLGKYPAGEGRIPAGA